MATIQDSRANRLLVWAFLSPTFVLILFVTAIPIGIAIFTSLHATDYAQIEEFVGLAHYRDILLSPDGWLRIGNSIRYVVLSLLLVIPLGIISATLLNRSILMRAALRTAAIIPWILSQTVAALLWRWMLNANFGPVVFVLSELTGRRIDFFNTEVMARFTVTLANVWYSFPVALLLTLAALQTIPQELYEAGRVDGASDTRMFGMITIPLIMPTVLTTTVLLSMEYFNMVTLIYVMTSGGPFNATETMSVAAFKQGFDYWNIDRGSAYSVLIFLLNILFSLVYVRVLKRRDR